MSDEKSRPCEKNECKPVKCIECNLLYKCDDPIGDEARSWKRNRQSWRV